MQDPIACHQDDINKAHGRIERRTYEVFKALPMLYKWQEEGPFIREVVRVSRYREEVNKTKPTQTEHYYVSNKALNATEYAKYIREHWLIENKLNNIKDVAFQENSQTKRINPYVYSVYIGIALNITKLNGIKNIKLSLFENSLDFYSFYDNFKKFLQ